ncbi:MAG: hypothetical protein V3V16_12910 [Melioribacteraceae bacterium]
MSTLSIDVIKKLHNKDQEKISYFVKLLLKKKEYKTLSKEISERRNEIKMKETLIHKELWSNLDV